MKRVLITGATGIGGANLARRMLEDGHEVHLVVRPAHNPARIQGILDDVRLHLADLGDEAAVGSAVRRVRPEWIFHLAAYGAYSYQTDLGRMLRANIAGTAHLVQASLETGFEAFIHAGSSSEYGFKDHAPSEQEFLEPNSHYAVTKAAATLFCRQAAQRSGLCLTTLRLYSVYGPYEEPTRLIPTVIAHGLRGTLPPLVDPDVARDFVYIRDVEDAFLLAADGANQEPGAVYNLGTGVQTSIKEVVEVARKVMGVRAEPAWGTMPNRAWDSSIWVSDSRKIQARLNWKPRYSFEAGLREMVDRISQDGTLRAYYPALSPTALPQ
jgi:nucleoside-diphosphate-sugar epimerase